MHELNPNLLTWAAQNGAGAQPGTHSMSTNIFNWKRTDPPNIHERSALALMFRAAGHLTVIDLARHGSGKSAADPIVGVAYLEARGWVETVDAELVQFTDRFGKEATDLQSEEARRSLVTEIEAYVAIADAQPKRYTAHVLFVASAWQARDADETPLELREIAEAITEDLTELLEHQGFEEVEELKEAVLAGDVDRAMRLAGAGFELVPREDLLVVLGRHGSAHLLRLDGESNPDARLRH